MEFSQYTLIRLTAMEPGEEIKLSESVFPPEEIILKKELYNSSNPVDDIIRCRQCYLNNLYNGCKIKFKTTDSPHFIFPCFDLDNKFKYVYRLVE